jgi:hypothetical protein
VSSVVIVTDQCYLLAESVNYIIINEAEEPDQAREYMLDEPKKRKAKSKKKKSQSQKDKELRLFIQELKPFYVVINFEPKGGAPNGAMQKHNSGDSSSVRVQVLGLRRTLKVFKDIVTQLREQIPDERFLDTLVDRFLASVEEDQIDKLELR